MFRNNADADGSVIVAGNVGYVVWNCHRQIGVSPGAVSLVRANSFTASLVIAPATRSGCCSSTA